MSINGYEGDDFTPEENISDEQSAEQDGSFSRPDDQQLPSTPGPTTQGEQQGAPGSRLEEHRTELLKSKVDSLYKYLGMEPGKQRAEHYDLFFERDGQLFIKKFKVGGETYMEKRITKKNGQFPTIGVLEANLGKGRLQALGFAKFRAQNLIQDVNVLELLSPWIKRRGVRYSR